MSRSGSFSTSQRCVQRLQCAQVSFLFAQAASISSLAASRPAICPSSSVVSFSGRGCMRMTYSPLVSATSLAQRAPAEARIGRGRAFCAAAAETMRSGAAATGKRARERRPRARATPSAASPRHGAHSQRTLLGGSAPLPNAAWLGKLAASPAMLVRAKGLEPSHGSPFSNFKNLKSRFRTSEHLLQTHQMPPHRFLVYQLVYHRPLSGPRAQAART